MPPRRAHVIAALAGVVIAAAAPARADEVGERAALRVVIVVDDAAGARELAARVDGQVSDLDVELRRVDDAAWDDGARVDPLGASARLAAAHAARVVVWFDAAAAAWTVHVAEPAAGRVLTRRVATEGDLASSASAEAVALVVRAAVAAIADGGAIGVEVPARAEVPARVEAPAPRDRMYAALGWTGVAGGAGPWLQHGAIARGGVIAGRWRAGLALGVHAAITVDEPGATMELSRGALGASLARDLVGGAATPWRASLELGGVASRFARVTVAADEPLAPTAPAVTWVPAVTASLRGARRLAGRVWLEVAVGGDALLRVPEFGLEAEGGYRAYARLDPVQPHASLSLVVDAP
jgi:hypothetical protein